MYEHLNHTQQRDIRETLIALFRNCVVWPLAIPLMLALFIASLAALIGLDPLAWATDILHEAAAILPGLLANLWMLCYLVAAFYFGVGRRLPELMQDRPLFTGVFARFTQTGLIRLSIPASVAGLFDRAGQSRFPFGRLNRTRLSTVSDLAGASPRLE